MLEARFVPLERWPRKKRGSYSQTRAPFKASYPNTLDLLETELRQLNAKNVTIEADFTPRDIRNDGWPRSSARPKSPGVIVSFDSKHGALALPCDRFNAFEDNLRAIAMHLHHLRKSNLYDIAQAGEQYCGWAALPAEGGTGLTTVGDAAAFLARHSGFETKQIEYSADVMTAAYRTAAQRLHPDRGGETHLFQQLQNAMKLLRKHHGVS